MIDPVRSDDKPLPSCGGEAQHGLTVCTVSYRNARHLRNNWRLTHRLASGPKKIHWVVGENTPAEAPDRVVAPADTAGWLTVVPGPEGDFAPNLHHALALNLCLKHVETRFLLVLDPDFYLVGQDWASDVVDHMIAHDLAVFGVPWHPKHGYKYRYFPCVHCLFIDLEKIPLDTLDFRPLPEDEIEPEKNARTGFGALLSALSLQHRRADPTDTGTLFYRKFHDQAGINHECAIPVYRLAQEFPEFGKTLRSKILQRMLPDHLCYVPKTKGYFTDRGFAEYGLNLPVQPDWEEFMWQGKPFGFHVRRNAQKGRRDETAEVDILEQAIESLCEAKK